MKTTLKNTSIDNKNLSINSNLKIDKKLDKLKITESKKQEEIKKLTFNLNL